MDGMILYGTPEEILEYQKLHRRMQDNKGWEILNKPVPFVIKEDPLSNIANHLEAVKHICEENEYEYFLQVRPDVTQLFNYQSRLYLLDEAVMMMQKQLREIKSGK